MSSLRSIARLATLSALLAVPGQHVAAVEGPTRPDSIVFNHTIPFAADLEVNLPLYLTRRGQYFAQVFFDHAAYAQGPVNVSFSIDVLRRGELLFTRAFDRDVAPNQRGATLFRINTDRELPLKTNLDLVVRFGDAAPAAREAIKALTFQIQLKPHSKGRF